MHVKKATAGGQVRSSDAQRATCVISRQQTTLWYWRQAKSRPELAKTWTQVAMGIMPLTSAADEAEVACAGICCQRTTLHYTIIHSSAPIQYTLPIPYTLLLQYNTLFCFNTLHYTPLLLTHTVNSLNYTASDAHSRRLLLKPSLSTLDRSASLARGRSARCLRRRCPGWIGRSQTGGRHLQCTTAIKHASRSARKRHCSCTHQSQTAHDAIHTATHITCTALMPSPATGHHDNGADAFPHLNSAGVPGLMCRFAASLLCFALQPAVGEGVGGLMMS